MPLGVDGGVFHWGQPFVREAALGSYGVPRAYSPETASLMMPTVRRCAHASRASPRLTGKPGRFALGEVPQSLSPRRLRFGIETANQGISQARNDK